MQIRYLTNILDPILKSDKQFRKNIKSLLVSEKYTSSFNNSDCNSEDFDFLLSDNGNFTRLSEVADKFKKEYEKLDEEIDLCCKNKQPLPLIIIERRKNLNSEIIKACQVAAEENDHIKITSNQVGINPNGIIGAEDTTIPVLQICGAFDERITNTFPDLRPLQKNTAKLFAKQCKGEFGAGDALKKIKKYIVVHSIDHNSAVKAINKIKFLKYDGVAVSLGGPIARKGFLTQVKIGRKTIKFGDSLPESYVLSVVLLLAFKNHVNKNTSIHILGLGSPILILLAGYIFRDFKHLSIDSTATYRDVEVDYIYGNKNGLHKMNLYKLAAYCIANNTTFKGISPYFKHFEKKYPSNWKKLSAFFKDILNNKTIDNKKQVKLIRDRLELNPKVFNDTVPFFSPIPVADKKIVKELRIARAFENYWVNHALCETLNSFRDKKSLSSYVLGEIKNFERFGDRNYIDAINESVRLIDMYE